MGTCGHSTRTKMFSFSASLDLDSYSRQPTDTASDDTSRLIKSKLLLNAVGSFCLQRGRSI